MCAAAGSAQLAGLIQGWLRVWRFWCISLMKQRSQYLLRVLSEKQKTCARPCTLTHTYVMLTLRDKPAVMSQSASTLKDYTHIHILKSQILSYVILKSLILSVLFCPSAVWRFAKLVQALWPLMPRAYLAQLLAKMTNLMSFQKPPCRKLAYMGSD